MEINFMILRKSIVSDKTDLLSKIKDMLNQLFTEVKSDYIVFTDKDNNAFKIPYKCSKSNIENMTDLIDASNCRTSYCSCKKNEACTEQK